MTAPFAALEARTVTAVFSRLANATATGLDDHSHPVSIDVLFDAPGINGSVGGFGMASTQPSAIMPTASLVADPVGWELTINAVAYVVTEHEPDGTGISRLTLGRAP